MTQEQDEKEFKEWLPTALVLPDEEEMIDVRQLPIWMLKSWLEACRKLREKIKSDPSIGKLEVEDWPESPDY